jgi:hypothetical protein
MSIQVVRDKRKAIDARLRALQAAQPAPGLAIATLQLMEDITTKRGRFLTELPIGKLSTLFSYDHVPELLKLYSGIRNTRDMTRGKPTKRIADQVALRMVLDELVGEKLEAPRLFQHEAACTACRWPAVTRCRRCHRTGCGLERCMPELLQAVELPYQVCHHRGIAGDLRCAIRNDVGPPDVRKPSTSRPGAPVEPREDWKVVGELGVDSGLAGIVPIGGGSAIKVATPSGDGAFPIEIRACPRGNVQARVAFASPSSSQRLSSVGPAGSYSGFFAICDPVVSSPGVYALSATESERVWLADFGILVRAARVDVTGFRKGRDFAQLMFDFRPTVKSVPYEGS